MLQQCAFEAAEQETDQVLPRQQAMDVERFIDHRRPEAGLALHQEGGRQHVEIAGVDDIGGREFVILGGGEVDGPEDRFDPLRVSRVVGASQIDIVPVHRIVISAVHGESDDIQTIVAESLHTPSHGGVGGVMSEKGNPRHGQTGANNAPNPSLQTAKW